jgi:phosphatidylglycerophosphatase A
MDESAAVGAPKLPGLRFLFSHPAHWLALGWGSGLSPIAPGTAGTLAAWASFALFAPWLDDLQWAAFIGLSALSGCWLCAVTARNMGVADPGSIVWDEVVAFWLVLWLVTPCGLAAQAAAFVLFRFFDAAKPGPVGWADSLFHHVDVATDRWGWYKAGLGIMLDDIVAALCTLLVIAIWRFF